MKTCETCVYCDKITNVHNWTCHRYPSPWQTVFANNWCGEFKAEEQGYFKDDVILNEIETERKAASEILTSVGIKDEDIPDIILAYALGEIKQAIYVYNNAVNKGTNIKYPVCFIKTALKEGWEDSEPEPEKQGMFQDGIDYLKSLGKKDK